MIDSLASHLLTSSWSQSPTAEYSTEITRRQCFQQELWGLVHMETLLCVNSHVFASFCLIVHVDPIINTLFWNLISRWKNSKTPPLCSRVENLHNYQLHHRPAPRPLAFDLWTPRRLRTTTTTTTTMVDYVLVLVLQKILSLSELLEQNILLLCRYTEQKRIMDDRLAIFARKLYVRAPSLLLKCHL